MAKLVAGPSSEILEAALSGLEAHRTKLDEQIAHVRSMLGHHAAPKGKPGRKPGSVAAASASAPMAAPKKKRTMSPEARKRIAIAQRKRWAAFRKSS